MPIVVNLDVMLAKRKMSLTELAERVGITLANLSILKNGKARAIRFSTLEGICRALDCQPGDILEHRPDDDTPLGAASLAPPRSHRWCSHPPGALRLRTRTGAALVSANVCPRSWARSPSRRRDW